MLIKRHYDPASLERKALGIGDAVCTHVEVKHTGTSPEQNFSTRLVTQAMAEGWMSVEGDKLTMRTAANQPDLVYTVVRTPGTYAKQDGARIPISDLAREERMRTGQGRLSAKEAAAFLAAPKYTDKSYEVIDHFACVLSADQHDMFKKGA